jgi:hypothetical protein
VTATGTPMTKEFSHGGRVGADAEPGSAGAGAALWWPCVIGTDGRQHDLSVVAGPEASVTDKVVLHTSGGGWADLVAPNSGEALRLEFPSRQVRFLGVCSNIGAWPYGDHPGYWVAMEPCTGATDRLDEASARGQAQVVEANGKATWQLNVHLRSG